MDRSTGTVVEVLGDWTTGEGPMYRKLASALREAVTAGDLGPGARLPAERRLADALAVSRATVVAAYDELRAAGLADSRQGSGTRVSPRAGRSTAVPDGRVPGGSAGTIYQRLLDGPGELISLTCAAGPGESAVTGALTEVLRQDLPGLLAEPGYHPRGLPALRAALADHLTGRGLATDPRQLLVTTGAHQALVLATELYLRPGATVVVESPNWPGSLDVFRAAGARLVGVPLDDEGIRPDLLDRALAAHAPSLLYVMPTFHNPTGVLMSEPRRRQVAAIAARHNVPILEDNAYSGYARDAGRATPLGAYAGPEAEVLTVDSLGKTVWGGLRLGWVRGPAGIIDRLGRRKVLADLGSPVLEQAVAARLLPDLEAVRSRTSAKLARQLDRLETLLREWLPEWTWRSPDGGGALWLRLPDTDAAVYAQLAQRHGVEVVPGSAMDPEGAHDDHIRVPFTYAEPTLDELVRRLARAWSELRRHGPCDEGPVQVLV